MVAYIIYSTEAEARRFLRFADAIYSLDVLARRKAISETARKRRRKQLAEQRRYLAVWEYQGKLYSRVATTSRLLELAKEFGLQVAKPRALWGAMLHPPANQEESSPGANDGTTHQQRIL